MNASFVNETTAEKYGLSASDVGQVNAQETRDGVPFVNVIFQTVEVCGVPAALFVLTE